MRSDIFMRTSAGSDWRKGMLHTDTNKKHWISSAIAHVGAWGQWADTVLRGKSLHGPSKQLFGAAPCASVWFSPAKKLHWMGKALETTLHEYGLVALAIHNPQPAVRSCCRSKHRDRGRRCVSDRWVKALSRLTLPVMDVDVQPVSRPGFH